MTQLLNVVDQVVSHLGFLNYSLDAGALIQAARDKTGLHDFGEVEFTQPLQRFLDAISSESALTTVGKLATRWDLQRFLTNLLRMRQAEQEDSRVTREQIVSPIFITGLPRSGTTFLHRLMMLDPTVRVPRVWETIFPYPLAPKPDRRLIQVSRQLKAFEHLAPEFRALHPLDATSPQECSEITAHVFRSLRFDTNYRVPSYSRWLDSAEQENVPAIHFHKRFLQHLQHRSPRDGRQWVLKCPEHVFTLPAIKEVYPDARIIFVHRDPVRVLLSVAKLTEVLRRPFTREIDVGEIGRQESSRWLDGSRRMIAASDNPVFTVPVFHVHYKDLVGSPLSTLTRVYQHFGMELPTSVTEAVRRYTSEKPNGGYGPRSYSFEDHGLDPGAERDKFKPYLERFGITPEWGVQPQMVLDQAPG